MKLTLVLTHQCDLACVYCYSGRKFARTMAPHVGARAIDRALSGLASDQTLTLGFFGGEPLLAWPLARTLASYARARAQAHGARLALQLTTNGTHLSAELLDEALRLGFDLTVSMDGLPAVHDAARPTRGGRPSSDAALAAIDLPQARGAAFQVNMVVRPENLAHLAAGARFLADRGVARLLPSLDHSAAWRAEHGPTLKAVTRVFATGALGGAISLTALGFLVAPMTVQTSGSTRSLRIDRQRRAMCMELRITPEELAELEASGRLTARLTEQRALPE